MNDDSAKTVALVTGGGRGIGAATARLLASQGYAVVVNFHTDRVSAEQLVDAILAGGGVALAVQGNVADEADVKHLFDTAEAAYGPVTHLVNNAGILLPQSRLVDISADRFETLWRTNVLGSFLVAREAVRRLQARGLQGAIVNVSSLAAKTGSPFEYVDYAATKGAVDTMTKGLALEVAAHGIRVNAVRPGFIHTQMHADGGEPDRIQRLAPQIPMQRGGTADEVAQTIAWLLSPAASYMTGSLVDVGGGK